MKFVSLKKVLMVAVCGLAMTGCDDEIKGTMTVNSPLSLKDSKGKAVEVNAGAFETKVSISKDKLKFQMLDQSGKMRKIELKHGVADAVTGDISIPAAQSGQAYDVYARKAQDVQTQVISQSSRSCSECVDTRQECGYEGGGQTCENVTECNPNDASQCKTRKVCRDVAPVYRCHTVCDRYFYGYEDVTRYQTTKTTSVLVSLKNAGSASPENAAQFAASSVKTSTSTSVGSCR